MATLRPRHPSETGWVAVSLPVLYSFRRCPYAMRARMSIVRDAYEVELREVVLRDRPDHMMEISPKGTVPVLLLEHAPLHLDVITGEAPITFGI